MIGSAVLLVVAAMKLISDHPGPLTFLSDLEWEWYAIVLALTTGTTALAFDRRRVKEIDPSTDRLPDVVLSQFFSLDDRVSRVELAAAKVEQEVADLAFAPSAEPQNDGYAKLHDLTVEGQLLLARCPRWASEDPGVTLRRLFDEWLARVDMALSDRPQIAEILRSPMAPDDNENMLHRQIERAIEALKQIAPSERRWDPDGNEIF